MTKNIIFKLELSGRGVVNFDDADNQKYYLKEHCGVDKRSYYNDNIKVAKKVFTKRTEPIVKTNADGEIERTTDIDYKLKISSTCLRHAVFANDAAIQNPKAFLSNPVLAHYATSIHSLLRGYTALSKDISLTRKGALTLSDAIVTNDAQIFLECHSNLAPKEKNSDKGSTSLYYTEQVGDTHYEAFGSISLKELQFLSADPFFGRLMLKPEWLEGNAPLFHRAFESHYGDTSFKTGYYSSSTTTLSKHLAEYGVRLSDDFVKFLVREQLKRLLNIYIGGAESMAYTSKLKVKLVDNGLGANFSNDEGWIEINTENVETFDFDMFNFYDECSEEEVSATMDEIERTDKIMASLKETKKSKGSKKSKEE